MRTLPAVPLFKMVLRHLIPSVLPTIIIAATTSISNAIMTESSPEFLRDRYSGTAVFLGKITAECTE